MKNNNNGVIDFVDGQEHSSPQQGQLVGLRDFYFEQDKPCTGVHIRDYDEVEMPLERTRLMGPFGIEVIAWMRKNPFATMGWDADGKEYIEY